MKQNEKKAVGSAPMKPPEPKVAVVACKQAVS